MLFCIFRKKTITLYLTAFFITYSLLTLTGCGNTEKFDTYRMNMEQFFENVEIFDSSINSINPESETAVSDLLSLLDAMEKSFSQMASLEVPDGFPGVADLASEASEYMSEAVFYYHQAFEGEEYDPALADVAKQNYDRANLRLQYIVSIFHGDIPEEIYTYEDTDDTDENQDIDSEVDGESEGNAE